MIACYFPRYFDSTSSKGTKRNKPNEIYIITGRQQAICQSVCLVFVKEEASLVSDDDDVSQIERERDSFSTYLGSSSGKEVFFQSAVSLFAGIFVSFVDVYMQIIFQGYFSKCFVVLFCEIGLIGVAEKSITSVSISLL